jgi:PTH1 family peptidyl-tRNA hydrolase
VAAWLVVGLGNPGDRYAATRHNIGAWVAERLAERLGTRLRKARFLPVEVGEASHAGARLWILRPMTWMNVCGPPVASFARRKRIPRGRVVACHDDIDLAFGSLKVKRGGSTAGHRGLESLVGAFRGAEFYRIRVGVGRPPGRKDPARYVLEPFSKAEREDAALLAERGADAVLALIELGLERAQDRFNRVRR